MRIRTLLAMLVLTCAAVLFYSTSESRSRVPVTGPKAEAGKLGVTTTERDFPSTPYTPPTVRDAQLQSPPDAARNENAQKFRKLEDYKFSGYSSPSNAFETAVWAATTGRPDVLTRSFEISPKARAVLIEQWQNLSEETRKTYSTPDDLVTMAFSLELLKNAESIQILDSRMTSATEATVTAARKNTRRIGTISKAKIEMHLGSDGWKLYLPDEIAIGTLQYLTHP